MTDGSTTMNHTICTSNVLCTELCSISRLFKHIHKNQAMALTLLHGSERKLKQASGNDERDEFTKLNLVICKL